MRRLLIPMPFPVPAQERYVPYDMMLNDVGFWYPILTRTSVNTPKTIIITSWPSTRQTAAKIQDAMDTIGYPCFFRGGSISASLKHRWKETCFIENPLSVEKIQDRMGAVISHCVAANDCAQPLLTYNWAVREYIDSEKVYAYREMPLKKEIRVFIKDNNVSCMHHYWDEQIPEGVVIFSSQELNDVYKEAEEVAKYFYGYWSCDFMLSKLGRWFAIDMALGEDSFHGSNCQKLKKGVVNVTGYTRLNS